MNEGIFSIIDISKRYNIGYSYSLNVAKRLTEIGYVKTSDEHVYSLIQTEQIIDEYVKNHLKELKPIEYDRLGLKDNGDYTLKTKAKKTIKLVPMFICRILFSPLSIIMIIFFAILGIEAKATLEDLIMVCIGSLFVLGVPLNIFYNAIMAQNNHIKFKDFMLRPWFHQRFRYVMEINHLLHKSNIKVLIAGYDKTITNLKSILSSKKNLAKHYADLANNATNENEFYQSINSCLETLKWMTQFEKFNVYSSGANPSLDIKKIEDEMEIYIERFNNKMKSLKTSIAFDSMEGHDFEYFCAELLRKNGFINVEVTQGSGDHGIDVLAEKDGITYAIQCKCYSSNIGNAAVQQAHTGKSLYHRDIAVVMTNQYFTQQAIEEANALGVKLWNRDKVIEMDKYLSSPATAP